MTYALERNQAARLRRPDSDGVSFYLGDLDWLIDWLIDWLNLRCACLDRKSTAPNRLSLSLAHSITMSECEGSINTWKGGGNCERLHLQCQEAMDYACAPPREKTRLNQMTISNTLAVRSGRLLTTSSIRWSRLYMSAHSYDVAFHCILINTWLNQARTTLLITQDKRTRQ